MVWPGHQCQGRNFPRSEVQTSGEGSRGPVSKVQQSESNKQLNLQSR